MSKYYSCLVLFIASFFLQFQRTLAAEAQQVTSRAALENLASMNGFEADAALFQIVEEYFDLPSTSTLNLLQKKKLFDEERIAQWTASLDEFLGLVGILFSDIPAAQKKTLQRKYDSSVFAIRDLQTAINSYVHAIHPGFSFLNAQKLRDGFKGKGIHVAVFDVFESDILEAQRRAYPRSRIHAVQNFGRPVGLSHGNTVIDIILQLAPEVSIYPISSDSKSYTKAFSALSLREDIDILNMSRAFAEAADHSGLDPAFKKALKSLAQKTIIVKSLGNTGTDLDGKLTPVRENLGLGPIGQLFAYDLKLIRDYAATASESEKVIFALNLSLFADRTALSATIPGHNEAIQARTLAVPAEGVYSRSTDSFESGSSFAAPQISALAALLLEAERKKAPGAGANEDIAHVYRNLQESGQRGDRPGFEWGLGLLSADLAL